MNVAPTVMFHIKEIYLLCTASKDCLILL